MSMVLKLRHYRADEVSSRSRLWVWGSAGMAALILGVGGVFFFALGETNSCKVAQAAQAESTSERVSGHEGSREMDQFVSCNWGHLEKGRQPASLKSLETNLECADWHNREALKGLKAMAVYEVQQSSEDRDVPTTATQGMIQAK